MTSAPELNQQTLANINGKTFLINQEGSTEVTLTDPYRFLNRLTKEAKNAAVPKRTLTFTPIPAGASLADFDL